VGGKGRKIGGAIRGREGDGRREKSEGTGGRRGKEMGRQGVRK